MTISSPPRCARRHRHRSRPRLESMETRTLLATFTVASLADAGPGTLREAIERANMAPAQDQIDFAPDVVGTIKLDTALPALSSAIFLNGPSASVLTIARNTGEQVPAFRIFTVTSDAEVVISALTIARGSVRDWGDSFGGGIKNEGTLTLLDCVVTDNDAESAGGIFNTGNLTIRGSFINRNFASILASTASGGGLQNTLSGVVTIEDSSLSGNTAFSSRVAAQSGIAYGGGLANSGEMTIIRSTISGNSADGFAAGGMMSGSGGGIYNSGTLDLLNSTLSGNRANASGSGITSGGTLRISHSTISANNITGAFSTISSIFDGGTISRSADSIMSLGHNLFFDSLDASLTATDLVGIDPKLGPLADNGGPTLTHSLSPGSPAINAAVTVENVTTDQRGVPRPQGMAPDIGAFELEERFIQPPTVVGLSRLGYHARLTRLVLTFDAAMDPTRAGDLANYRLVIAGPDRVFGTPDDRPLAIDAATYDEALHTVTLATGRRLPLHLTYRLTVVGTPPGGLTSASGVPLDGAGTGDRSGSDYEVIFGREILVRTEQESGAARFIELRQRRLEHREALIQQHSERLAQRQAVLEARRAQWLEKYLTFRST